MPNQQYAYAVARIRSKELTLLNSNFFEQLLSCHQVEECLRLLRDKGWGNRGDETISNLLQIEHEKTWALMQELVGNEPVLNIFFYQDDYHNLKAALKSAYNHQSVVGIYRKSGTIPLQVMEKAAYEHDFTGLPEWIRLTAEIAYEILFQAGDSQLSDALIDKDALAMLLVLGKTSNNPVAMKYAEIKVATTNIQIVRRSYLAGKRRNFLEKVLVPCESLEINSLMDAFMSEEGLYTYLGTTPYAEGVEDLKNSLPAFEKWCDNKIIALIQAEKYNPFTLSPLIAYALARENEIKSVSILLHGKQNDLPEQMIRERLRKLYV